MLWLIFNIFSALIRHKGIKKSPYLSGAEDRFNLFLGLHYNPIILKNQLKNAIFFKNFIQPLIPKVFSKFFSRQFLTFFACKIVNIAQVEYA